jgi:hypothetical protein
MTTPKKARIAWLLRSFGRMKVGSNEWRARSKELRQLGVDPPCAAHVIEARRRAYLDEYAEAISDIDPNPGEY